VKQVQTYFRTRQGAVVSGFSYCGDWDAEGVFAVQELQKDHYAFGAVVGEEDGFEFLVGAAVYAHTIAGFKGCGVLWYFSELVLEPLLKLVDKFVCYSDWLFAERHQLVHSAG
jgi:hypothetical protein